MRILEYLERVLSPFDTVPFGPVDSAVLSQLCMVRADRLVPPLNERRPSRLSRYAHTILPIRSKVTPANLLRAEHFEHMFTGLAPDRIKQLLFLLSASPRFRDLSLFAYQDVFDPKLKTQFAALSASYRHRFTYV